MSNIRKLNHLRGAKLDETSRLHFATIFGTYFGIFIGMPILIISFFVPILRFLGVSSDLGLSFDQSKPDLRVKMETKFPFFLLGMPIFLIWHGMSIKHAKLHSFN
jgi:hypothetical protein